LVPPVAARCVGQVHNNPIALNLDRYFESNKILNEPSILVRVHVQHWTRTMHCFLILLHWSELTRFCLIRAPLEVCPSIIMHSTHVLGS
jgi:hypothetical protein